MQLRVETIFHEGVAVLRLSGEVSLSTLPYLSDMLNKATQEHPNAPFVVNVNDLSMLDGRYARWPAAPGNAIDEVKEAVRKAGGYVATARCSDGVVEALRHFFEVERLAPPGLA